MDSARQVSDVIIPVKNSVWWVAHCLEELFRCTEPRHLGKVLVVDDGSTADAFALLQEICARFPTVHLFKNAGRPGFGGACNFAADQSTAPYLLFLNTDCLVTPGAVNKLITACASDAKIGLACPLSNNSPVLTLPLFAGRTYLEMNELVERATAGKPVANLAIDACTVVGNCLMVSRACWQAAGPFDEAWGKGYGEETDLQFRAMAQGFRGVCAINTYVYHFGSASFRYETDTAKLQKQNHDLFLERWGQQYRDYAARCEQNGPIKVITRLIDALKPAPLSADVLFILPGISQTVGGVHVVLGICNHLIRNGVNAKCLVLGELNVQALHAYQEPILFGLLHYPDAHSLLTESTIRPRLVVATLYTTSIPALKLARTRNAPLVNFVQGYEFLFDNGERRGEVEDSYVVPDEVVVTSRWLETCVRRVTPSKPLLRLPIGIGRYLFRPALGLQSRGGEKLRVGVVLRTAPDKGQAVLLEMLEALDTADDMVSVTVFSSGQTIPGHWQKRPDTRIVRLPMDQGRIAAELQRCDVYVDASLHEGFGLMPLEAMGCGATVIASDSGGVTEFLKDRVNGLLIREVNKPERYVEAVLELAGNRELLGRLRAEAQSTARGYHAEDCYDRYLEYFRRVMAQGRTPRGPGELLLKVGGAAGLRGVEAINQTMQIDEGGAYLRLARRYGTTLLPPFHAAGRAVLRVEVVSPAPTRVEVRGAVDNRVPPPRPQLREIALEKAIDLARRTKRRIQGRPQAIKDPPRHGGPVVFEMDLPAGRSAFHFSCLAVEGERLCLSFAQPGTYVVASVQGRLVDDSMSADDALFDASATACLRLSSETGELNLEPRDGVEVSSIPCRIYRSLGEDPALLLPPLPPSGSSNLLVWIDVSVPAATTFQLYYLTGRNSDYREDISIKKTVHKGRNIIVLLLKRDEVHGRLRLDPGMVPGDFELNAVTVHAIAPPAPAITRPPQTPRERGHAARGDLRPLLAS